MAAMALHGLLCANRSRLRRIDGPLCRAKCDGGQFPFGGIASAGGTFCRNVCRHVPATDYSRGRPFGVWFAIRLSVLLFSNRQFYATERE